MNYLFLIPISIILGLMGLGAFFWAMRHNQYEDLDGAAARVLNAPDRPLARAASSMKGPVSLVQTEETLEVTTL
jgi:cbb3-type cytochrome oxidase maturation protein